MQMNLRGYSETLPLSLRLDSAVAENEPSNLGYNLQQVSIIYADWPSTLYKQLRTRPAVSVQHIDVNADGFYPW